MVGIAHATQISCMTCNNFFLFCCLYLIFLRHEFVEWWRSLNLFGSTVSFLSAHISLCFLCDSLYFPWLKILPSKYFAEWKVELCNIIVLPLVQVAV